MAGRKSPRLLLLLAADREKGIGEDLMEIL